MPAPALRGGWHPHRQFGPITPQESFGAVGGKSPVDPNARALHWAVRFAFLGVTGAGKGAIAATITDQQRHARTTRAKRLAFPINRKVALLIGLCCLVLLLAAVRTGLSKETQCRIDLDASSAISPSARRRSSASSYSPCPAPSCNGGTSSTPISRLAPSGVPLPNRR